jgi:natural product biosynthesis luciferase-like monooxygenase protein
MGSPTHVLRAFFVGGDTLLTECAEVWLQAGHEIDGILTRSPRIRAWARARDLNAIDLNGDFRSPLDTAPFDYLFSVTHLEILPEDMLSRPRLGAVNFHDGPLPLYAGINAPCWALMEGVQSYGVRWHRMTKKADEGAILAARDFEVTPAETAVSINTKCFMAGLESFRELVSALESGDTVGKPQDLSNRSYFGKFQRPEGGSALDWSRPAAFLEAFVRALDFGPYPNPLAAPKIATESGILWVREATATQEAPEGVPERAPGTVVAVTEDALLIQAAEGLLRVAAVAELDGSPLALMEAVQRLGLEPGRALVPFSVWSDGLAGRAEALARAEHAYLQLLETVGALHVVDVDPDATGPSRWETRTLELPTPESSKLVDAAFAALFLRLSGEADGLIAVDRSASQNAPSLVKLALSAWAPLSVELDPGQSFQGFVEATQAKLGKIQRTGAWLRDAIGRQPVLRELEVLRGGKMLPVGLGTDEDLARSPGRVLTCISSPDGRSLRWVLDANRLSKKAVERLETQFLALLKDGLAHPEKPVKSLDLLGGEVRKRLLEDWNQTARPFSTNSTVPSLFQASVAARPHDTAVVAGGESLSYQQLNGRANQLAAALRVRGLGVGSVVGLAVDRSVDLLVGTLGIMKAGAAYLPLDPNYPRDRVSFMVEDSGADLVVTTSVIQARLGEGLGQGKLLRLDADASELEQQSAANAVEGPRASDLAYLIYTSGSTGKPKGVEVEHRNVVNFFEGMDDVIPHDPPGVWLAVTSLSFDISVLELFWTLTRGFKVVLQADASDLSQKKRRTSKKVEFSLFYFSSDESLGGSDKYRLLLEGARFADEHGFNAVWTPERHFHAFGGLFPNPSVTGAAVAAITRNVSIRAGSCVLPLHHPVRIAEEWSVVDNISGGRVGLSFASGWQPNDFVLRPESYGKAKELMFEGIETVQRLWRGETLAFPGATGEPVELRIFPRPVQAKLPFWITTAGNPETYQQAGAVGGNVLTHLLGQSIDQVIPKIQAYRAARQQNGFDPGAGIVSLMLHTFVGDDPETIRNKVREPLKAYLGASLNLLKKYAWSFPAFSRPKDGRTEDADAALASLSDEDRDAILEQAFLRYYETSGLFGRPEDCAELVHHLAESGVDEIACLIDFGVPTEDVLQSLTHLDRLRALVQAETGQPGQRDRPVESVADAIATHGVTHLQCTPSMARMLLMDERNKDSLRQVHHVMIGGEAFPVGLAEELAGLVSGSVTNMYGPTETTIWSLTHDAKDRPEHGTVPIGRPIANTQLYVLDGSLELVPVGVPGELFIGGDGVVRGYRDRPALNTERFLPDPFRQDGSRMYRTGDRVRYRQDGVLEFLGRVDFQVKLRGYRIELGEIEAVLASHPSVREAVVSVYEDAVRGPTLVGYTVLHGPVEEADLKNHLRSRLPDFMVPARCIALSSFPLTPNGKIDRKKLPSPTEAGQSPKASVYVAPSDDTEGQVADIWKDVLGRERVGVDDNFFDLGGHSLLIVQMHARLKQAFSRPVSLTDLYRFTTVRALASFLSAADSQESLKESQSRAQRRLDLRNRRRR